MIRSFLIVILLSILSCQSQKNDNLTIATAANMQYPLEELIDEFEKEYNIKCEAVIGSSGKLTAQIIEGAPYHILLSADMKYPIELFEKGLSGAPKIYGYGKLVFWTLKDDISPDIEALAQQEIEHMAIANPKTAPYGKAAMEVFRNSETLIVVENKLVYGESISQTNQFILSEAADIGVTAKSSLFSPHIKNLGKWQDVDQSLYSPIAQGVVVLNNQNQQKNAAIKFYEFLFSNKGKEILNKFGYSTPE